jgi:hypothetical protein
MYEGMDQKRIPRRGLVYFKTVPEIKLKLKEKDARHQVFDCMAIE